MPWIQPKTDWESSDKFNASDYNRIKGNLNFLHERAEQFYPNFGIIDMGEYRHDIYFLQQWSIYPME
mgnify:CR=1 FL=1